MRKKVFSATVVTLLLAVMLLAPLRTTKAQFAGEIKIGIIGPQALSSHWYPSGMKAGAELAAMEINASGGVYLSGGPNGPGYYSIKLVFGHEHAITGTGGDPEPDKAAAEMDRLMDPAQEDCDVVIGGFRTECVMAMIPVAASYGKPYFINGASTSGLTNATTLPYIWRINPVNSTILFQTIAGSLAGFLIPVKLLPLYGHDLDNNPATPNQVRVAVISEDLAWTIEMHEALTNPAIYPYILGPHANVTYDARIDHATPNLPPVIAALNASKARLLIIIFSGQASPQLIGAIRANNLKVMVVGIDVIGQLEQYWALTSGACDYESLLNFAGTRTPIVPGVTDIFWDHFVGNFSAWPMYTAWGAYDGVHALAEAYAAIGSLNKDALKAYLEDPSYERLGLNGRFKYTSNHDVFSNEYGPYWMQNFTRAMMVQWQVQWNETTPIGGRMEVVCPIDQVYSKKWAIPPWLYPLIEDITYDGFVGIDDVSLAAIAFGSYPGHPRWEKEADINFDNFVDISDIARIARNFGTQVQLPLD